MSEKVSVLDIDKAWMISKIMILMQKPALKNKVSFYRLMFLCQKAWLGIRESLTSILSWEKHWWMKRIIDDMILQLSQWTPLYWAMQNHKYFFSAEETELIKSAESIWNLPEVLENIADELESYQALLSKVKNAMIYPVMILIFAIWAVILLLVKVMPTIVELFPSREALPWITKFMLWASDFLQTKWYVIPGVIILIATSYILAYAKNLPFKIVMDRIFLTAPVVWDIARKFNLYRFCKLLADFYNAWVSPIVTLTQIYDIMENYHYKQKVLNIKSDLEVWLSFTEAMEWSWLFDNILIQIISVWEKTWNTWEVLIKMSNFYKTELNNKLEWLMKLIEPLLMWFIAIIVWVIVASIFLPMADLIGTIW